MEIRVSSLRNPARWAAAGVVAAAFFVCSVGMAGSQAPEFTFEVVEETDAYIGPSGTHIYLKIRTTELYPCYNYALPALVEEREDVVGVILGEVEEPADCAGAVGPAQVRVALDPKLGSHVLEIVSRERVDEYTLYVDGAAIEVTPEDAEFTEPTVELAYRLPPDSLAYRCSTLLGDEGFCEDFDREVREFEVFIYLLPDDGLSPYALAGSGQLNPPQKVFQYRADGTWAHIAGLVRDYTLAAEHVCGRTIEAVNWHGERAGSWEATPSDPGVCDGVEIPSVTPEPPERTARPGRTPETTVVAAASTAEGGDDDLSGWLFALGGGLMAGSVWLAIGVVIRKPDENTPDEPPEV